MAFLSCLNAIGDRPRDRYSHRRSIRGTWILTQRLFPFRAFARSISSSATRLDAQHAANSLFDNHSDNCRGGGRVRIDDAHTTDRSA